MKSFGAAISVTGPDPLEPEDTVWFSNVRIFKTTKNGHIIYDLDYAHPTNRYEIDAAVRSALQTVVERLNSKGGSQR